MTKIHKWNTEDTVTSVRMAASLMLLILPLRSAWFLVVYTFAGLTDALDGWLARKTGTASEFGARLDSVADLLFYGALLLRIFPILWQALPATIWYAVAAVVLVRLAAYAVVAVKYYRFASLHTWLNKLTGGAVFLLPYVLALSIGVTYSWAVCVLALAASVEELAIHLCQKNYSADRKSIFQKKRCSMMMPRLKTERLLLREVCSDDTEAVFNCWMQDENVSRYMWWKASSNICEARSFVEYELGNLENDHWDRWMIVLKETRELIGTCLLFFNDEEGHWDISYNLGTPFWGKGYITEAMHAVMRYAVSELGIQEITTSYAAENPASGRVLQKLGFTFVREIPYACNGGETNTTGILCRYAAGELH